MSKPKVMIFVDYYLPGYKAGGPIASVSRMVKNLSSEFDIFVFTRDRDLGDDSAFPGIASDAWTELDGIPVFYAGRIGSKEIATQVKNVQPDLVYLNSYFSVLSRHVLRLAKRSNLRVALAPRGEFSKGALALKALKKKAYITLAGWSHLTHRVVWHVSSIHEREDVLRTAGPNCITIVEAPDMLAATEEVSSLPAVSKQAGEATFAWISRISPKKNLIGAIRMLADVKGKATLTIYGPSEDAAYWQECQNAIALLPGNVKVEYKGGLTPPEVLPSLSQHHFFLFPTFGENFGHVIPEALCAGCPVLLSDQTPWLDLDEHHAGWVLPLDDEAGWAQTIQACVDMGDEDYQRRRDAARAYIQNFATRQHPQGNSHLFEVALAS
jgi:glycosyltransferase involved in cell wall biosynthesis